MASRLFHIISFLFHPILLPTFAMLLLLNSNPYLFDGIEIMKLVAIVFLYTTVFPLITILLMLKLSFISSIYMKERKERILPYMVMSFYLFYTYWVIHEKFAVPDIVPQALLGITLASFAAFFFNLFFKISMHTIGAGYFMSLVLIVAFVSSFKMLATVMMVFLIAGLVGSARLYLKAHHPVEIYFGYGIGLVSLLVALQF